MTPSSLRSFWAFFVRNLLYRSWFSLNISGNDLRPRLRLPQLSPVGQADFPGLADSPRFADFPTQADSLELEDFLERVNFLQNLKRHLSTYIKENLE